MARSSDDLPERNVKNFDTLPLAAEFSLDDQANQAAARAILPCSAASAAQGRRCIVAHSNPLHIELSLVAWHFVA